MNPLFYYIILVSFFLNITQPKAQQQSFRILSYNTENLFDCEDDPRTNDNEFLPNGIRRWSKGRYYHKLQQLAKVIIAAGKWDMPAIIGLCEVENDSTLIHLLNRTPLKNQNYRYVMTHGSDKRGINNTLIYQRSQLAYIEHTTHRIYFKHNPHKRSRDLLRLCGRVITGDTLDCFLVHFPSKAGGERETEQDRKDAAHTLRKIVDSLFYHRTTAHILIMGDFNDSPTHPNIKEVLGAKAIEEKVKPHALYNLFAPPYKLPQAGTHKYQDEWSLLDQFIVSGALCDTTQNLHVTPSSATILSEPFLFKKDKTHRGLRLFRTYHGYKYEGGYSDHLPIILDISLSLPELKK